VNPAGRSARGAIAGAPDFLDPLWQLNREIEPGTRRGSTGDSRPCGWCAPDTRAITLAAVAEDLTTGGTFQEIPLNLLR
jgi:hypothetical protein